MSWQFSKKIDRAAEDFEKRSGREPAIPEKDLGGGPNLQKNR